LDPLGIASEERVARAGVRKCVEEGSAVPEYIGKGKAESKSSIYQAVI